jgi:hypothetical protein
VLRCVALAPRCPAAQRRNEEQVLRPVAIVAVRAARPSACPRSRPTPTAPA